MSQLLANKVIAITGCSTGIGRATALECAKHGARLVLHHIGNTQSTQDVRSLANEIHEIGPPPNFRAGVRTVEVAVDVQHPEAGHKIVDAALETFGEINGAVHNAGICQFLHFTEVMDDQLDRHMSINYKGAFRITQQLIRQMRHQGKGGSIVSIASVTATMGSRRLAHYSATKAALLGMTVSCAVELGKYGIRFNALSPGTIETALNEDDLRGPKRALMEARVPLGRLGVPEDIANAVIFLTSDLSRYISGQNLIVDGAASINYQ